MEIKIVVSLDGKEAEMGIKEAESRLDMLIDLLMDISVVLVHDSNYKKDSAIFREHMHKADILSKDEFCRNFSLMLKEPIQDIVDLVGDYAWLQKNGFDEKRKAKKVEEDIKQTKKQKKSPNF